MNADQRKYLIKKVEDTYSEQHDKLEEMMPKKPSLNNYLVAACLDGSLKMNSIESIKTEIKKHVIDLGPSESFIEEEDEEDFFAYRSRNRRRSSDAKIPVIKLDVRTLFVVPPAYGKALAEWEQKVADIRKKQDTLRIANDTIIMKLNLGSNAVLDKLIEQADNLVDLNLMNQQLVIGEDTSLTPQKQLPDKNKKR